MAIPERRTAAADVLSPETGRRLDVPGCIKEAGILPAEA
ncbi:hypothetical protein ACVW1C_007621 [Bradyrhizobium sp. USDA 4011]